MGRERAHHQEKVSTIFWFGLPAPDETNHDAKF
jgi:hypothetical protein